MTRDYRRWATTTWQDILCPFSIGRINYLVRYVLLHASAYLMLLPFWIYFLFTDRPITGIGLVPVVLYLLMASALMTWFAVFGVYFPRIYDAGLPRKSAWLLLVPGINIIFMIALLFVPGRATR